MHIGKIYKEVEYGTWQPTFEFTVCQADAIDSMLQGHEDYDMKLHSFVKEILDQESNHFARNDFRISLQYALALQATLFRHKKSIYFADDYKGKELPNMYIKLGIRTRPVKVGLWYPPIGLYVAELINECFLIDIEQFCFLGNVAQFEVEDLSAISIKRKEEYLEEVLQAITNWYKVFEIIHPLDDLNGRVGGIIANLISYKLTGMWFINTKYRE